MWVIKRFRCDIQYNRSTKKWLNTHFSDFRNSTLKGVKGGFEVKKQGILP